MTLHACKVRVPPPPQLTSDWFQSRSRFFGVEVRLRRDDLNNLIVSTVGRQATARAKSCLSHMRFKLVPRGIGCTLRLPFGERDCFWQPCLTLILANTLYENAADNSKYLRNPS